MPAGKGSSGNGAQGSWGLSSADSLPPELNIPGASPALVLAEVSRQLSHLSINDWLLAARNGSLRGAPGISRDINRELGRKQSLTTSDFLDLFKRNPIAGRVVRILPDRTWSVDPEVYDDTDPKKITKFEAAFQELVESLDLWAVLSTADKLARISGWSGIVLGAADGIEDLSTPLTRARKINYLSVYLGDHKGSGGIETLEEDRNPGSARYLQPLFYEIHASSGTAGLLSPVQSYSPLKVHYSRVIHYVENRELDSVYGTSCLEDQYDLIEDLTKVEGAGAESSFRRFDPGMSVDVDPSLPTDGNEMQQVRRQVTEYIRGLRRVLTTRGAKITRFESDAPRFDYNVDTLIGLICIGIPIPQRIFEGSERGELASEQDRDTASEFDRQRRRRKASRLVRSIVNRSIEMGALPKPNGGKYLIDWPDEQSLDDKTRAEIIFRITEANKNEVEASGRLVMLVEELRDWLFPELEQSPKGLNVGRPKTGKDSEGEGGEDNTNDGEDGGEEGDADNTDGDGAENLSAPKSLDVAYDRVYGKVRRAAKNGLSVSLTEDDLSAPSTLHSGFVEQLSSKLEGVISKAFLEGARTFKPSGDTSRSSARFSFDPKSAQSLAYVQSRVAQLLTNVLSADDVDEIIESGLQRGLSRSTIARQIKSHIGLTPHQLSQVDKLRIRLSEGAPGSTITVGQSTKFKIPKGGLSAEALDKNINRYVDQLVNRRADLIAETESASAVNAGVREHWRQAQDKGLLSSGQMRVWEVVDDGRCRDKHLAMAGQKVAINAKFNPPIEPGEEPRCRCGQRLDL